MKYFIPGFIIILFLFILFNCEWNYEERSDIPWEPPCDTCCGEACCFRPDTCDQFQYTTFESFVGTDQDDEAWGIILSEDGHFVVVGQTVTSNSDTNIYVAAVDTADGSKEWGNPYGDPLNTQGVSIIEHNNSYIILSNYHRGGNQWQPYLIKLDKAGVQTDDGDNWFGIKENMQLAYSIVPKTGNQGYFILGYSDLTVAVGKGIEPVVWEADIVLGEKAWYRLADDDKDNFGHCMVMSEDNKYVALVSYKTTIGSELNLLKYEPDMKTRVWSEPKTLLANSRKINACLRLIPAGGYIIAGATTDGRLRLVKTDENGSVTADITISETTNIEAASVCPTRDGGFVALTSELTLVKVDSDLQNYTIINDYEGQGSTNGNITIVQTNDGGYAFVGHKTNGARKKDIWIVKTDPDGKVQQTK